MEKENEKEIDYDITVGESDNKTEYDIPAVESGLEEVPIEPDKKKDKTPPLPPEKIQEIIEHIKKEEKEDEEHKKKVDEIIRKIHR